jgi:DNA repair protein RadC
MQRGQQELFAQDPPPQLLHYVPIYRITLVHDGAIAAAQPQFRSSAEAADVFRRFLGPVDREHFLVAMLDRKNRLIGINTVAIGSLSAAVVHPREVFKPAILSNAASIIVGHNHPSGDPQPSSEDRLLTYKLYKAGQLLGIELLDHVIIGDGTGQYFSFADAEILHKPE